MLSDAAEDLGPFVVFAAPAFAGVDFGFGVGLGFAVPFATVGIEIAEPETAAEGVATGVADTAGTVAEGVADAAGVLLGFFGCLGFEGVSDTEEFEASGARGFDTTGVEEVEMAGADGVDTTGAEEFETTGVAATG